MKPNTIAKPEPVDSEKLTGKRRPDEIAQGSSYASIMKIIERTDQIPDEVWEGLPDDFSKQLDHYLYGTPKVPD